MLSSALAGFCFVELKKERLEDLLGFSRMLEFMSAELCEKLSPLPDMTERLREKTSGKAKVFLELLNCNLCLLGEKDFGAIWSESLKCCQPAFTDKEYSVCESLGQLLGKYDVITQSGAIAECAAVLNESAKDEGFAMPQFRRLSIGASLSLGALVAILLI